MVPPIATTGGDGHGDLSAAVRGEAVLQLLRRISRPVLMVLEDLHWADPDTLAIVEYLSDNLSGQPVLCLATCRLDAASAGADLITRLTGRRAGWQVALGACPQARSRPWYGPACRRRPTTSLPGSSAWPTAFRSWSRSRWPRPASRGRSARGCAPGSPN